MRAHDLYRQLLLLFRACRLCDFYDSRIPLSNAFPTLSKRDQQFSGKARLESSFNTPLAPVFSETNIFIFLLLYVFIVSTAFVEGENT